MAAFLLWIISKNIKDIEDNNTDDEGFVFKKEFWNTLEPWLKVVIMINAIDNVVDRHCELEG